MDVAAALERLRAAAAGNVGLRALLLFGSRARGDAAETGDWDFGYLADDGFDPMALRATLVRALATDAVDLVDLATASGLLRFRAARDGILVSGDPSLVASFRLEAASFWCEAEPVLRSAYDGVLERL